MEDERKIKSEGREEGKKERGFCCRSREDVGEGIFITVICASSASERAPSARSSSRAGKERKKGKEEGESENGVRPKCIFCMISDCKVFTLLLEAILFWLRVLVPKIVITMQLACKVPIFPSYTTFKTRSQGQPACMDGQFS